MKKIFFPLLISGVLGVTTAGVVLADQNQLNQPAKDATVQTACTCQKKDVNQNGTNCPCQSLGIKCQCGHCQESK